MAALCKEHFQQRFWYASGGYLYDVIDGPGGNDSSLRPNQLLALSLRHAVLDDERQHTVFEHVTQQLLTPLGLRTLALSQKEFSEQIEEKQEERDRSEEQESIQPWFIGPYINAMLAQQDSRNADQDREHDHETNEAIAVHMDTTDWTHGSGSSQGEIDHSSLAARASA